MRHQDSATGDEHLGTAARLVASREVTRELSLPSDDELSTIPNAVFVLGPDARIEDVNPLAETLVGYPRSQLLGQGVELVMSYATRSTSDVGGRVQFVPAAPGVLAHHRNGRDIPVELLLCPHGHGSTMAIVRAANEPDPETLRKETIEQVVHDLRNPLGTIGLETDLLEETAAGVKVWITPALARIRRNVAFLERLAQDLLDASSMATRRFEIRRQPTELRSLLEQLVDRVVPTRDRPRVVLDTPSPLTLPIDAFRIERVVANLLQNALKYAPRDSKIVLRLDVDPDHGQVSVTDVGPGMTPAETSYVFDKYRRTPAACMYEGSGLGLYVCKQIIEAHGGTIGVDSVLGAGSRFFFELPVT
jgi:PAS domain S-box-containing protein